MNQADESRSQALPSGKAAAAVSRADSKLLVAIAKHDMNATLPDEIDRCGRGRHQTAALLPGGAKRRLAGCRFDPGIDQAAADLEIFAQIGTSPQRVVL